MLCQLVFSLKRNEEKKAQMLGNILASFYPEKETNKKFIESYENIKGAIKKEKGEKLLKISPFWYPVVFYLSLLNIRANTFLALKILEGKKLLDSEIKRRQYKVFYIYAIKNGQKEKIYATSSKESWKYWFLLFQLVVSAPSFLREELEEVGKRYYEALKKYQI